MNHETKEYTLSVFTENQIGLIGKIAAMFTRRKISLESFNTSETEFENIYRFTIVLNVSEQVMRALAGQIDRLVDVMFVCYNTAEQIIWQQQALFKIPTENIIKNALVERLLNHFGAKTVAIRSDYTVFEVTGQDREIKNALHEFEKYGLTEFVRGSRIAIMKSGEGIHARIAEIEENNPVKDPVNNAFLHLRSKVFQM